VAVTTVDVDVLVAGAGAAGLAAALAAAQRGAAVLLVDGNPGFRDGCTTAQSTSMVPAGGSRWQRPAGIDDSRERFLDDVMRKTRGEADPVIAGALTGVAPELVAWLADGCGVTFELVTDFVYPGHSRPRCHSVPDRSGRSLHQRMLAAASDEEGIELVVPRRLAGVAVDGEGPVAQLASPDGELERVRAGAVVLATGGFGANAALVREHAPEIAQGMYFGGDGNAGDALAIGAALDADAGFLDAYQWHAAVAVPHGVLVTWATVVHGAVLVNARGERFGDESSGYSEFARLVLAQPDGIAWVLFDERIEEACRPFADFQQALAAGAVREAADLGEVAAIVGAPAATLERTLDGAGAGDAFGRTSWEAPLTPPYRAVKVSGALFHTQGGLMIDGEATVLRGGRPIRGLHAAGGAAAGMSGHGADGYLAGNGLLAALGLGFIAGRRVSPRKVAS
jgi:fumarate reductase flavoprotein subunit